MKLRAPSATSRAGNLRSVLFRSATLILAGALLAGCASPQRRPPSGQGPGGDGPRDGGPQAEISTVEPIVLLFTDYDGNGDRRITKEELDRGIPVSFAEADTDRNGRIQPVEYAAWARAALGSENALPGRMAFNPYSSISPDEFRETLDREFTKRDKDSDGVLTRTELLTPVSRSDDAAQQRGSRPSGGRPQGGGSRPPMPR